MPEGGIQTNVFCKIPVQEPNSALTDCHSFHWRVTHGRKHRPAGFSQQTSTSLPTVMALTDLEKERIPSRYPAIGSGHIPNPIFKVTFGYFKRVTQSCLWHASVTVIIYRVTEMLIERSFKYFILLSSNLLEFTMSKDKALSGEERGPGVT